MVSLREPCLIPSQAVSTDAQHLRTRLNGVLVQEDTTAGLLCLFIQLVAGPAQLMALETGDVILTGAPAGSSVIYRATSSTAKSTLLARFRPKDAIHVLGAGRSG